jgi:type IV secretion system protein VirB10
MRVAQVAHQATESGVFFQMGSAGQTSPAAPIGASPNVAEPTAAAPPAGLSLDLSRDQNTQGRKLDFLSRNTMDSIYNPHQLEQPTSPYELLAGTIISASLISGLNSDLPGLVVAQVTTNIFDTATGRILLLPQGSRLVGTYDSVVAFGQSRALLVWQRIIMPNGTSIQIDNLPASDTEGYSGLSDQVDYHSWALLKGVVLSTLLGVSTQLTLNRQSDLVTAIRQSTQDSVNQAGQQITQKNLNIQPTITVRPGWPLRVIVHKDLILKPYAG